MSSTREQLIGELLASDRSVSWRQQLSAAFDDADVRDRLLAEIRAGLPADAPAELVNDMVFALCARPPHAGPAPTASGTPDVRLPSGSDLQQLVLRAYPYPIARPYRTLVEEEAASAFTFLLRTFEGTLHYLATVAVSAYLRGGLGHAECDRRLARRFLKGPWATGDLLALLRDVLELAGDCRGALPFPQLPAYLLRPDGKPTASYRVLASFVELRNAWAHGSGQTEAVLAEVLPGQRQRLDGELARLTWLTGWRLLRPTALEGDRVTRADVLMGDLRQRDQGQALRLDPRDLPQHDGDVRTDKGLLLAADDGRYLPLLPLSLFAVKPRGRQGVYLLQGCRWQEAGRPRRVHKALYLAYDAGLERHEEPAGDAVARRLEQLVERLEQALPAGAAAPTAPTPGPAEDPDCELPEVRVEQEFHLRAFVGRDDAFRAVTDWLDRRTEGGYLLLLGPPGQGKSAFLAELARREAGPGRGGLLHMVKSHANPHRFVPALIAQAARLTGARFGAEAYRGDVADLRNALVRALEAVRGHCGRAVLVLDALDELAGGDEQRAAEACLEFLPPRLPEGVRAVLSCRPDIPLVQALRARLAGLQERPLPPLTEADFRLLVERRLEVGVRRGLEAAVDFAAVFRRLGGNPLFLRAALDRITDEVERAAAEGRPPRVAVDELPRSLDSFFHDVYQRKIAEKSAGRPASAAGRQQAELLKLLCVAREPLGYEDLSGLLEAAGRPLPLEDCRDRLDAMSQFLLDVGGGRFKPWHQGLADYVRAEVLGGAGLRQVEETFCRWLARPDAAGRRYALRYRLSHLLGVGKAEDAATLLLDLPSLEARAETGLVFDLVLDFGATRAALPADHPRQRFLCLLEEALRLDLHFLARHPEALFQCLWTRGWWYDCSEAAGHYVSVSGWWPPHGPPWEQAGAKLCRLLEGWRAAKKTAGRPTWWLRSLRPPVNHLGSAQRLVFAGHEANVECLACSRDGRLLVSGSRDRSVRVWDVERGEQLACLRGHADAVRAVAISPDGTRVASGGHDRTIRLWGLPDGRELGSWQGHTDHVRSLAFSPDGTRLASGSWDGTVRVWEVASGRTHVVFTGHKAAVLSVAFSPDGRTLATAGKDYTVRHVDADSGEELARWQTWSWVPSAVFSPDGREIAAGSYDGRVWSCDVAGREPLVSERGHRDSVECVAYSPDGKHLASASADRVIRIWRVCDGGRRVSCYALRGHEDQVTCCCFLPDGQRLVSGSHDQMLRLWDVRDAAPPALLHGHRRRIEGLEFSPDGRYVITWTVEKDFKVWETATGREVDKEHLVRLEQPLFQPPTDTPAVAWRAERRSLETVIESTATGQPLARFPVELWHLTQHPSGRIWAGAYTNNLYLFRLEEDF